MFLTDLLFELIVFILTSLLAIPLEALRQSLTPA